MISPHAFRDEVIRQLEDDILSFGWLRQMAELDFGHPAGANSREAVFDLVCSLVDSGLAVVGDAKNEGKKILIYPWCERGEALKEKMARELDEASSKDQNWVFWLQLSAHQKRPNLESSVERS